MEEWDEARKRKSHSARCGHIKRKLSRDEPLTGKILDFALDVIATSHQGRNDEFLDEIAKKLMKGTPLTEYENHIVVDVILLHSMIKGGI